MIAPLVIVVFLMLLNRAAPELSLFQSTKQAETAISEQELVKAVKLAGLAPVGSQLGRDGAKGEVGERGEQGLEGPQGIRGLPGEVGLQGDAATDDQLIAFVTGTKVLSISGGNSVNLSSLLDNTDTLLSLSCASGQVAQWSGSIWTCANAAADTDDQTLSIDGSNNLIIDNGNSVNLASYLDNTDSQAISVSLNILSISGDAGTVDLSTYLDNTDSQTLGLLGNTLSLVSGGSVSLAAYLDNTDAQDLTLTGNTLALTGDGTTVDLSGYLDDTVLNETQVDAYVANNGYLTSEVDGSTTNELQNLTFSSDVIGLTSSGVTFDLSAYLDNTDAQDLSLSGNTLSLTGDGTNVSLAAYLDNTDSQSISVSSNVLSISGDVGTVDLSVYLDNTDAQALSLVTNTLSLVNGGSVSLAGFVDVYTAGNGVSVGSNEFSINSPTCAGTTKLQWTGSAFVCSADVDTVLNETQVDAYANNNGYLTTETDGVIGNEVLGATTNKGLVVAGAGTGVSPYTLGLMNCSNNEILKYLTVSSTWTCSTDATGSVGANSLNYTEFANVLSLDATTTTTLGTFNQVTNLESTGDFLIQDNGTTVLSVLDSGVFQFRNSANSTAGFSIQNSGGTDLFVIDSTNSYVYIGNPVADTTGSLLILDTKNTTGDPTGVNGSQYYNSSSGKFRCYQNGIWEDCVTRSRVVLASDVVNNNAVANTIADVTGLSFPVTSGVRYSFVCSIWYTSAATTTGSRWTINGPTTISLAYGSIYSLTATTNTSNNLTAYNLPAASNASSATTTGNTATIRGFITPSASGSVIVRFASEVLSSAITAKAGSSCEYWSI